YLDKPIPAAGLTEFDLEQGIVKAYRDAGLMAHAQVSVTVVEARGRAISIMGEVNKPGEYLLQDNVVRLLCALATRSWSRPTSNPNPGRPTSSAWSSAKTPSASATAWPRGMRSPRGYKN